MTYLPIFSSLPCCLWYDPAMRRWQHLFPLFLLTLLALPALQPLFNADFTCGFDNNFHLWRAVEIGELLRGGVLYSRWAPHMAYGYGYPLFLFQSPLSAYIAALFNLAGLPWSLALNATYGLSLLFSGWTMWLLGRELWGQKGGLISAVAYLYAPYHAYVLFNRGSLSESVAWIFPPLILWGLRRWQLGQERWGLVAAVFGLIAMMLSHDPTTYAFLPLFVAWIVIQTPHPPLLSLRPSPLTLRHLLPGLTALALGLGGSAFFWLPAWLERPHIQFDRVATTWPFRYFDNFLPLPQLLAWPRHADPLLLNDWPERGLGILLLAAASLGFLLALRLPRHRLLAPLLILALAAYTFLTLPQAQFIWEAIPPLAAFTPWRFLAPASLIAAVLCGAMAANGLARPLILTGLTAAAIVLLAVGHWGWFYPDHCSLPDNPTAAGITQYELDTDTVGTTAKQELLPTTVQRLVKPDPVPLAWYERLDPAAAAGTVQLIQGHTSLLQDEVIVEVDTPTTLQYRFLHFPGWQVLINGTAVPITPSDPEGWIQFDVPNGRHTLTIRFAETPTWLLIDWLSLLALLATITLAVRPQPEEPPARLAPSQAEGSAAKQAQHQVLLLLLAIGLLGLKWQLVDKKLLWPRLAQAVTIEQPTAYTFGGPNDPAQIRLLGHQTIADHMPANQPLALSLYWQTLTPSQNDYRVGLTLVDNKGLRWSQAGLRDDRWLRNPPPTPAWSPDKYVQTAYLLDPLPGTPPGLYRLRLSLFDRQTLSPLTIYDETGQAVGPWLELGQLALTRPQQPGTDVTMQYEFESCTALPCLRGSNIDRAEAAPGDKVLVTLFWSADNNKPAPFSLSLIDEQGTAVTDWPFTFADLPVGLWRNQQLLQLPAALEDGPYRWQITFADGQTITWADLQIDAPERSFAPPDVDRPLAITLAERVTLWGATVRQEGQEVIVELVWRAERPLTESYHTFLHLLGPDGSLLAQSDGVPGGNRPTTGWLPGEYITDVRRLPLPPDEGYTLQVGLYLPGGERLQTAEGQDAILLEP